MTQPEVERFERSPRFTDAVALRKWDDEAKVAGKAVAAFATYVPVMEELAQRWAQS
jgi:predicted HD phosphohydrolase